MKKLTMILVLLCLITRTVYGVSLLGSGISTGGVTIPARVALYYFESGAMVTDSSSNTNTLTEVDTVLANTTYYQDGAQSSDHDSDADYYNLTDASQSSDFPGMSTNSNLDFTVCVWFRPTFIGTADRVILGKYNSTANERSWRIFVEYNAGGDLYIAFNTGHTSGASANAQIQYETTPIILNTAYTACASLDAAGTSGKLRLYNASDTYLGEATTSSWTAMSPDSADFRIGEQSHGGNDFSGQIDFVQIWDTQLSDSVQNAAVEDY